MVNQNYMIKHSGQVFTPDFLVSTILDYAGYISGSILQKHVIDNSCGDGAFLCEIVSRYCEDYISTNSSTNGLRQELETFIHGIELDNVAFENCLFNLNNVVSEFGITDVKWNVLNANALSLDVFDDMMDFVIGNPPYVSVHNLGANYDDVKSFTFAQGGMTDLYLVFCELGLRMLNESGKLCYITPSSWLSSLAATNMRSRIMRDRILVGLIDLGHFQAFAGSTTYTMISLFDATHDKNLIEYYQYSDTSKEKVYVDSFTYEEMSIGGSFYVASRNDLSAIRAIKETSTPNFVKVKNGLATLADKVFIGNVSFKPLTIPIIKASTGKWEYCFFPYDVNGKPLGKDEVFSYPDVADYLEENKDTLLKGRAEEMNPDWYLYGRTQAIKDVYRKKYSINFLVRNIESIRLNQVPAGAGVYSGLYIVTDVPFEVIERAIKSEEFINYISALKHYKSGGYYTYSSKDLEQYLNYKISQCEDNAL